MLELQKFILANPNNWEQLLSDSPFYLKIKKKNGLVIFNYNQIKSDFDFPLVKECRGVILEEKTWKVIRLSFIKFFNYREKNADEIDWTSATVTEKVDGSIIGLYFYNGKWRVCTNSTIDADDASLIQNSKFQTYKDLFYYAWENSTNLHFDELNPNYCYTMELVSPQNRVVIRYDQPCLYLLSIRDMSTLKEVAIENNLPIAKPKVFSLTSLNDCLLAAKELGLSQEGYVVKDKFEHRIKIKSPEYVAMHYLRDINKITLPRLIDVIKANEISEFLTYHPESKSFIENVQKQLKNIDNIIEHQQRIIIPFVKKYPTRKDFSLAIIDETNKNNKNDINKLQKQYLWLYFMIYNGQNVTDFIKQMNSKGLIKQFNLKLDEICQGDNAI